MKQTSGLDGIPSLHVTGAETAPAQDIMTKVVDISDTQAFTSILHATNTELQTPTQLENLDPGFSFQNVLCFTQATVLQSEMKISTE